MNREAMARLLGVLLDVRSQGKPFDITRWQRGEGCDTAACAIGWVCRDTWFRDNGLVMRDRPHRYPVFNGTEGMYAVATFFQITTDEAEFLFHGRSYPTPDPTVANVIDRVSDFFRSGFAPAAQPVAEPDAVRQARRDLATAISKANLLIEGLSWDGVHLAVEVRMIPVDGRPDRPRIVVRDVAP